MIVINSGTYSTCVILKMIKRGLFVIYKNKCHIKLSVYNFKLGLKIKGLFLSVNPKTDFRS